jgi:hypothetical protein
MFLLRASSAILAGLLLLLGSLALLPSALGAPVEPGSVSAFQAQATGTATVGATGTATIAATGTVGTPTTGTPAATGTAAVPATSTPAAATSTPTAAATNTPVAVATNTPAATPTTAATPTARPTQAAPTGLPSTGEGGGAGAWLALSLLGLLGVAAFAATRRQR